jgi:metal-responsive CopG/Arc/MetJ family transcriptional regulator
MTMRIVTFKIPEELLDELDDMAAALQITRSEAIRRALELWMKLNREKTKPKPKVVKLLS